MLAKIKPDEERKRAAAIQDLPANTFYTPLLTTSHLSRSGTDASSATWPPGSDNEDDDF